MKAYLTKRYWFSSSHRLHNDELSEEENRATYGKCDNQHGHNYGLEVTVSGQVNPHTGMICDLGELDAAVEREVIERFGHENLNTLADFKNVVPTSENLASCIFDILKRGFRAAQVEKVKLDETSQNTFEFAGGGDLRH